jgi:RNA polymerase sigma-B factor
LTLDELSDDELLRKCRQYPRDSTERSQACEVLVRRYAPLVKGCVRPYRNSPEGTDDLMQVGFVGLLKAINNYNPEFGNGLKAYAVPCVTGEIKRHFRDKRWQVRVSRTAQELLLDMRDAAEELTHELERPPQDTELAARLAVSPGDLREAQLAAEAFNALSLDAPVGDAGDSAELSDLFGEEDSGFDLATNMEALERHWDELPHREQQILLLRFYGNLSQEQVAGQLGLSQMHVSRLQSKALARLRERLLGEASS